MSRGSTLYILDEPTTGLHPSDVEKLVAQLELLVDAGNTVICVEHDMRVVAGSDHVIDMGPGAGDEGGRIVASGTPTDVAASKRSRTATYLARFLLATLRESSPHARGGLHGPAPTRQEALRPAGRTGRRHRRQLR